MINTEEFQRAKKDILARLKNELPAQRSYHSIDHTIDVYDSAARLAAEEGVNGDELTLLLSAALFHDSGFIFQGKNHEMLSCQIANETLPAYGYTESDLQTISGMIMATRIPQEPHNLLEKIICDADLDYLGRDDFYSIGSLLEQEMKAYGTINNDREWDELQVRFLEQHHYWTDTALRIRKPVKDTYVNDLKRKIKQKSN